MHVDDATLMKKLEKASASLTMQSEIDHPLEPFLWERAYDEPLKSEILRLTSYKEGTVVEIVELDDFFQQATEDKSWHKPEQQAEVERFRELVKLLKNELKEIKVYRLGTIYIDVYIAGLTQSGNIAGIATKLMET